MRTRSKLGRRKSWGAASNLPNVKSAADLMRGHNEITIVVPGVIVPWQRPRKKRHKDGKEHWFTKPEVDSYLAVVRHEAAFVMGDNPPLEGAIELSLLAVWLPPDSWSLRNVDWR